MKIILDPNLTEEVVLQKAKIGEETGDLAYKQYRRRADIIYEFYKAEEREAQFQKLHRNLFAKWGFEKLITDAIEELPNLSKNVDMVVVKKALTKREETADLLDFGFWILDFGLESSFNPESRIQNPKSKIQNPKSRRSIGLKIVAGRFESQSSIQSFLRHELMHVSDMIDENFKYHPQLIADSPMEENIIKERYKTLWDIYIDARLERSKKGLTASRDRRYSEFEALYRKLSPSHVKAVFDSLWGSNVLSHEDLLRMAKDVSELLKLTPQTSNYESLFPNSESRIFPGSPCPLCRFPSYYWAEHIIHRSKVIENIREDFPAWNPEAGCCERCAERYDY